VLWQRALAAAMVAILKTESHTLGMEVAHHGGGNQQTLRKQHECTAAAAVVVVQNKKTKETKQEWSVWYNHLPLLCVCMSSFPPSSYKIKQKKRRAICSWWQG